MSLHRYYQHLDFRRITQARERKGMTKKKLAELIGKQASAVSQFESGRSGIAFETFQRIVEALEVPPAYLTTLVTDTPLIRAEKCHFRANKSVSFAERAKAIRYAQDVLSIYQFLERQGIQFPEISFHQYAGPKLSEAQMEQYAVRVRADLGLGIGPIPNMAELLEAIGVRIILLPTECARLDAFASWVDGIPCIMVASNSPNSRLQFDYAHEFKHLLCDEDEIPDDLLLERTANRFASAFLMPQQSFFPDCPSRFSIPSFLSVKAHWRVSIKAALYRAHQLGKISEKAYRNAFIVLSKKGYTKVEPIEERLETPLPELLGEALNLVAKKISLQEIADEIGLSEAQIATILSEQGISSELLASMSSTVPVRRKAHLRLLK